MTRIVTWLKQNKVLVFIVIGAATVRLYAAMTGIRNHAGQEAFRWYHIHSDQAVSS